MTSSTSLGDALEAFILEHEYCGEFDAAVEMGLAKSLPRPGGNLTGLEVRPVELAGKRLQLFKEAVPTITRVAVLVDPAWTAHASIPGAIAREARALGVQLQRVEARTPAPSRRRSPRWPATRPTRS